MITFTLQQSQVTPRFHYLRVFEDTDIDGVPVEYDDSPFPLTRAGLVRLKELLDQYLEQHQ